MSSLVESLLNYLKKKPSPGDGSIPQGICPNCWGQQEYEGKFFEAVRNYHVDINEKDPTAGWVKEYAEKNLIGIQLEHQHDQVVCPKCKVSYKPE